jgi:ribosomal protein S18 acetylase RimI-like enzyme
MENCRLRPLTEEDHPFLYNSWLKSYRFSLFAERITNTIYFEDHHKLIEKIINNSKTLIACNPSDPSQLYGYIVAGEEEGVLVVHFLYVKHTFRNMGIGKTLLDAVGHSSDVASVYTHHTRMADKLSSKYNFVYHPYLMFDIKEVSSGEG